MLEGVVSEVHFSNLTGLTVLFASKNRLTLEVSLDWIPPFQLYTLGLGSWNLGPKFPSWFCSQKQLLSLDISNTGILDRVPPWFWNFSSQFEYLNISHNQIYGEIPHIPLSLSSTLIVDVSSNNFTGPLPCISSKVTRLDLSNNSLSGSISHFLCYKMNESKNVEFLNLGKNLLSGKISNCWMKWQSLIALNLGNNNFIGKIPASIGSLTNLQSLHLHNNKFSGKLLSLLKNCKGLFTIDIGKNEFDGSIPKWIGHRLSSLMIVSLHSNNFYGQIPDELCALTSLQILDLSHNKLFGSIPKCVNNFSTMARNNNSNHPLFLSISLVAYSSTPFESELLVIKGKSLEYSTTLSLVNIIDLSNNNLSGEIPKEVASLQGLQSLNLSSNILTGMIPENIGDMGSLESVDFSVNQLSGQIPQSMSNLTFLSHLNLSNNNLIGRIPSSTQLQSLSASSFFGNKLCGPPLIDNCTINYVKPNIESKRSKDFGGLKVDWFFVSMALGFVVGFWVVLGPLLWNKQWRILYFQFLDHLGYKLSGVVAQTWIWLDSYHSTHPFVLILVQHDQFFTQHNLSMRSFEFSVSKSVIVNYISPPEVAFLRGITAQFNPKIRVQFGLVAPWKSKVENELAQKELQKINMYKAPRDKLVCILNCCKVIGNLLLHASISSEDVPGADEFLPVLIYVTIKALSMDETKFESNMETARALLSGILSDFDGQSDQSDYRFGGDISRAEPMESKHQSLNVYKDKDSTI
ncbi:hypothetical protein RGQ29_008697 [Quercus rubra]|uniref:VPS9 domain-containing protein n=1 Tax=Quercus rubra TaxID=3512 RepID=A0AAN7I8U3_QUERU|nr:hypothetical protein RGQ29_008697 [Quercus rubra]